MHGNVWEWCQDYWHINYDVAPSGDSAWLDRGNVNRRVIRGGSWDDYPWDCRSARRDYYSLGSRFNDLGFRVSCSAPKVLV